MTTAFRALAVSFPALLISAAVAVAAPKQLSESHRLRHQCLDLCRSVATVCMTKCDTENCLDVCTEPMASCIDECRARHPG